MNDDHPFVEDDANWDLSGDQETLITWHFEIDRETLQKLKGLQEEEKPKTPQAPAIAEAASGTTQPATAVAAEVISATEFYIPNRDNEIIYGRDVRSNKVVIVSVPLPRLPVMHAEALLNLRPRVELFVPPTTNFLDKVSEKDLETPDYEFMQGLFRLAGIWDIRTKMFVQNEETSKVLAEASVKLTQILNDQWNQGKDLGWKLQHTGTNGDHIAIMIQDPSIDRRYTRPSVKSSGFRTYFLLSMIIYARTRGAANNSFIYLFDEPGTYLHPRAQLDLQKSFEAISDEAQLVYTTHSLFLINKNHPDRNKVINKTASGTVIDQKPFIKNWKSVRESLGILLSNNFLIAEKTLLVEGPSDIIYILEAIKTLKKKGKLDLDLNDLSIVDAGDSENYVAMAKLMVSEGRQVVALVDGDTSGAAIEKQLGKVCQKEITDGQLYIHKLPANKSSEDVFAQLTDLKSAIKNVANNLIGDKVRVLKDGINISTAIDALASKGETLGRVIDSTTAAWFTPEQKISKLSIALEYENLSTSRSVPAAGEAEIETLKKLLNLRGEKSMRADGIFEEVSR